MLLAQGWGLTDQLDPQPLMQNRMEALSRSIYLGLSRPLGEGLGVRVPAICYPAMEMICSGLRSVRTSASCSPTRIISSRRTPPQPVR